MGFLPSGTSTARLQSYQPPFEGNTSFTVGAGGLRGAPVRLLAPRSIAVQVSAQLREKREGVFIAGPRGRGTGDRQFLYSVRLVPVKEGQVPTLRPGVRGDEPMVVVNVFPGRYWVRFDSAKGYVAEATSGGVDLLREPLVVSEGANIAPIEVVLRAFGNQKVAPLQIRLRRILRSP